jgi:hypothetical protein
MKMKPVPKAILIAIIVGGIAYTGYVFTGGEKNVQAAPTVQAPVQPAPVAPVVQAPAPVPVVQQATPEVRQDMSANRGMSALMSAGGKK